MISQRRSTNFIDYILLHIDFIQDFFAWWYIDIPTYFWRFILRVNSVLLDTTSLPIIIRGFFRPFKNDYNIAGWFVGFILKCIYIPAALFMMFSVNVLLFTIFLVQLILLPAILAMIFINPFIAP
jgi:hypothetical protein